ncbi:hypothetical protein ES703_05225 [subsurface metagenome]
MCAVGAEALWDAASGLHDLTITLKEEIGDIHTLAKVPARVHAHIKDKLLYTFLAEKRIYSLFNLLARGPAELGEFDVTDFRGELGNVVNGVEFDDFTGDGKLHRLVPTVSPDRYRHVGARLASKLGNRLVGSYPFG